LLERGWTVRRAVLVMYGICGMAAVLSLVGSAWQGRMSGLALVVFAVGAWLGVQNLGYAELSTAGKMIRPRGFRKLLGAEMALGAMKDGLLRAQTGDEVWRVVTGGAKEFGFVSASMVLDGVEYDERWAEETEEWRLSVPLNGRGWLELGHGFESKTASPMADLLARIVKEGVGREVRETSSESEAIGSPRLAAMVGE
jgi:hypothetical protein